MATFPETDAKQISRLVDKTELQTIYLRTNYGNGSKLKLTAAFLAYIQPMSEGVPRRRWKIEFNKMAAVRFFFFFWSDYYTAVK